MNFFPDSKLRCEDGKYTVEILGEKFELSGKLAESLKVQPDAAAEREVVAGVRPVNVVISDDDTGIDAVIEVAEMMGSEMHLHMKAAGDTEIIAVVPTLNMNVDEMSQGKALKLKLQTEAMHLFDPETEESLLK